MVKVMLYPKINDENPANNTKVNVNKASMIELMSLKGIGEQTAQKDYYL